MKMEREMDKAAKEWKVPSDKPKACCIARLSKEGFIPGGVFFECPDCHSRIDMLDANKYTRHKVADKVGVAKEETKEEKQMKMYLIRETKTVDSYNEHYIEEARRCKKAMEQLHPDRKYEIVEEVK